MSLTCEWPKCEKSVATEIKRKLHGKDIRLLFCSQHREELLSMPYWKRKEIYDNLEPN
jgi:hypothetical protein